MLLQAITQVASELDDIHEQSVLSVHFRFNGDLVIDIDGDILCVIGSVPRMYSHVFPLIDLYGRVSQVSIIVTVFKTISKAVRHEKHKLPGYKYYI